jgi:hypothetical protein
MASDHDRDTFRFLSVRDPIHNRSTSRTAKAVSTAENSGGLGSYSHTGNSRQRIGNGPRREEKAERTISKLEWLFNLATPALGHRPIAGVTAPEILPVLRAVETRGKLETAKRLRARG